METQQRPRVRMDEIGLYLRTIQAEYQPKTEQEMADLISQYFNVICLPEDIEHYELLDSEEVLRRRQAISSPDIDWELEERRAQHFSKMGVRNPFE